MEKNKGYLTNCPAVRIPRPTVSRNGYTDHSRRRNTLPSLFSTDSDPLVMDTVTLNQSLQHIPQMNKNSMDSLDNLSMDDFWSEVENIKQSSDSEQDDSMEIKTPDEEEAEVEWLQDAGFSNFMSAKTDDTEDMALLSTLTKTQAAAVQRRLDTYTRSLRKRNKQPVRDVRDIFRSDNSTKRLQDTEQSVSDQHSHEQWWNSERPPRRHDSSHKRRVSDKEETFNTEIAYSEQATVLQKTRPAFRESRKHREDGMLPKFRIHKGRLGIIRINDLSPRDMKKINQLALIELTALWDILELDLKRKKAVKRKMREDGVFGVPLTTLLEYDQKIAPGTKVPLVLLELISCLEKKGLTQEGILRVPGSHSRIKILQESLESNFYAGTFIWDEVNQNDAAGLLKRFIRELPTPLLTAEYLSAFTSLKDIPDLKQRLQALNLLLLILPETNRNTLKVLLEFLSKVVSMEKENRMNLWNVSTIMAPNLFIHKGVSNKIPEGTEKQLAESAADVVRMLIHYQNQLWIIPSFLMAQIRKVNDSSSKKHAFYDKRIRNLLKRNPVDKEKVEVSQPCKTITIQTSMLLNQPMEIRLDNEIQAAHVLSKFKKSCIQKWNMVYTASKTKRNGSLESLNLVLCEIGGNINECILDPNTYLLDLYSVNPNADWVIKEVTHSLLPAR
ncbi:rho GTPase-activating protein 40 [Protopterus annectens]|uniref:rho GTPase-activating protein 40 n=1 Tax=Protopterus annectens TaxID=7888 RepID=UPI001CFABA6E|nr:rho GTPase-activating protein 40 [Protopterus annectens]